ncbi:MAG: methionine biosynthesis protein MetW [Gammaproteobacteria bacterium]|nr:methionine biosynthesis protein MetW [Gammaproteobacteria bacterium]
MRFDLQIIGSWIEPGSKVLDLGCGKGDLLSYLKENKQVHGTGIEHTESKVAQCIEKGLSVLQGDINEEVLDYPDKSFDYVILSQTMQQVYNPQDLLRSLLRIGNKGIVSFPSFSHWKVRFQLLATGYAPVTRQLPYEWYDTPNIRVITIKDFRKFSKQTGFEILKEAAISSYNRGESGKIVKFLPSLFATYGIFLITKGSLAGKKY